MDCETCTHKNLPSFSATCVECGIAMKNYKPITNADLIRAMADEELAEWISSNCTGDGYGNSADEWLEWLKSPVEESEG